MEAGLETGQVKIITENNTVACTWSADAARLALAYNGASLESPMSCLRLTRATGYKTNNSFKPKVYKQ